MTRLGVYVVAAPAGARWCVVARSAEDAARAVGDMIARQADIPRATVNDADYEVGRLGNYDPGIAGDRLALQSWPVITAGGTTR